MLSSSFLSADPPAHLSASILFRRATASLSGGVGVRKKGQVSMGPPRQSPVWLHPPKNKKEQPEADDRADEQQDDGQVRPSAYAGSDRKCRN